MSHDRLYNPKRHESLTSTDWDESRARAAIGRIVDDTLSAYDPERLWPVHPREDTSAVGKTLYSGASGVGCALRRLETLDLAEVDVDFGEFFDHIWGAWEDAPETGEQRPSWFLGSTGILVPLYRETGSNNVADRLARDIRDNIDNPTREVLWGAPGTMIAALFMLEWTDEERWADLFRESADALWEAWAYDEDVGCWLWTQDLYGNRRRLIGAGHGQCGNLYPLLRGRELLGDERRNALIGRAADLVEALATTADDRANWRASVEDTRVPLVQWCHGAPGVVAALEPAPAGASPRLDDMLLRGGELIWEAGPLTKGHSLCHGTGGNGYALLKLYARTGDERWLQRARRFAMHAIEQYERVWDEFDRGWFSLWTGDLGLATYLASCINVDAERIGWDII